jgi:hypothetical protein
MRLASAIAFASAVSAGTETTSAAFRVTQAVRVIVKVPPGTDDEAVYLTGSLPDVGGWRPDGVRLERQADGKYAGDIRLRLGARLEFKITRRGTWASVEKTYDGSERMNHFALIEANTSKLELTVERWAA